MTTSQLFRTWPIAAGAIGLAVAVLVPGPVLAAESLTGQSWTVIGFREPGGTPVAEATALFRAALERQLGEAGRNLVAAEGETKALLGGLSSGSAPAFVKRIAEADGDYQQFALDSARTKLESGLKDLASVMGDDGVWNAVKSGRFLLGLVHLAGGAKDAQARALAEFEAILRVEPTYQPSALTSDPQILELFEKARTRVARAPRGQLVLNCATDCPTGFAWIEGAPGGAVNGLPLKLPAGKYRIRITDRQELPHLRSFSHEVRVPSEGETRLVVDLESEGALLLGGGTFFEMAANPKIRTRALQVASQEVHIGHLAAVWRDATDLHVAVVDPATARVERHAAIALPESRKLDTAIAALAAFAVGGGSDARVTVLAPSLDAKRPKPAGTGNLSLTIAKWSTAGAAVAFGIVGGALAYSAHSDFDRLDKQYAAWGGKVPASTQEGMQHLSDRNTAQDKQNWGTGLLIGAGVCATASIVLFVVDSYTSPAAPPKSTAAAWTPEGAGGRVQVLPTGIAVAF